MTSSSTPAPAPLLDRTRLTGHRVRFELEAVKAWRVSVVGSFNGWTPGATPLIFIGGQKYATELDLAPGRYEYRFVVDDKLTGDPTAPAAIEIPAGGRGAAPKAR
jgi:1,4-alpha-glucan branching enzyme